MSHLKDKLNILVKELKNIFNNYDSDIKKIYLSLENNL